MDKALLVMDIINDLAHKDGNVGKDGFYVESRKRKVIPNTKLAINHARKSGIHIIYVVVGFSKSYVEWNANSIPFRKVKQEKQVILNSWYTEVCDEIKPQKEDIIVEKNRIDPFYNTNLELLLRNLGINELYLSGISTDMVILSTVFSAHDRDFKINTIEDCTSANNENNHESAINTIRNMSKLISVKDFVKEECIYEGTI